MEKNLDELRRMRDAALATGAGSTAWIDFATAMIDSYPHLYAMARAMNAELARLRKIELMAMSCDGIDMGRHYEVPTDAWEDLMAAIASPNDEAVRQLAAHKGNNDN